MRYRSWIFSFLLSAGWTAQATELRQFGESVRTYGMGGVRIPDSTDGGAFMWNPAALTYTEGFRLTLANVGGGFNATQASTYASKISSVSSSDSLSPFYGKPLWVGGGGYAAAAIPHFGLGYYTQAYLDFLLRNPAFPNLDLTYYSDTGVMMGGSLGIGPYASLGLNLKRIVRSGSYQQIGTNTLATLNDTSTLIDSFSNQGSAIAFDLGFMFRVHDAPMNPTLGLSWQDVGGTAFTKIGGAAAPDGIKDNMTLGATLDGSTLLAGLSGGVEYRHIGESSEQIGKKLHVGAELSLPLIDLRAGLYQGYTTYGLGLDLWVIQLDLASYSVEKGVYPGQTPDGRVQVGLSINLGFNPDFALMEMNSKRRKVKQRR